MLKYDYFGHACFGLDDGEHRIIVDPFLTGNPAATIKIDEVIAEYVLVTHAHGDHSGDAPAICMHTGATLVGIPEYIDPMEGAMQTIGMNLGGTLKTNFGFVRMVPALHSSGAPGGIACGYVIGMGGKVIYYSGDTALFSDMKLLGERDKIDCAVLPIGGHYTMDAIDAARAVEFVGAAKVIPLHYDTWDVIKQNPEDLKKLVKGAEVCILKPGESTEI